MSIPLIYKEDLAETITVTRTQRIHHSYDDSISYFCHLSKNLWNQAHHLIHGYYKKYGHVPSYEELDKVLKAKTKFDYVYPKFDVYDIIEGVVVHGLVPKRLSISDLMTKGIKI